MTVKAEISRISKVLVDTGGSTFQEAQERLETMSLVVDLPDNHARTPAAQAAALTAVVTASRCFLGGVMLTGATDTPLVIKLPLEARTMGEAAIELGGTEQVRSAPRTIVVGDTSVPTGGWTVRTWWDGWLAGVRSADDIAPTGRGDNPLAGVAAGALAVTQAFLSAQGDVTAGRASQTISLWSPGENGDAGPSTVYLPKALWFIGLGNLGQAYLWSLSMLPYHQPEQVELFFQDFDTVSEANWGTSVLVSSKVYGALKTRVAENWALGRGFKARRIDRRFDKRTAREDTEPAVAMVGLDSVTARKLLGAAGFDFVIDCGLGTTAQDYSKVRLTVFDAGYGPEAHFDEVPDNSERRKQRNLRLPAYQEQLAADPVASCGMAEVAGASAAAPFVSALAGALAITQTIRLASGQSTIRQLVCSVEALRCLRTSSSPKVEPGQVGYAEAMQC